MKMIRIDSLTDAENARLFAERNAGRIRYCHETCNWLIWSGSRWCVDTTDHILELVQELARSFVNEPGLYDGPGRDPIAAHGRKLLSLPRMKAAASLARSKPGVPISPDELDADPMLFGVENGVIDLRLGQLRPAEPEDYVTKRSPVSYNATATCPIWHSFLRRIMGDREELIAYLQRLAGLWLTGDISEQELPIFIGSGANGKSVFVDTIMHIMGDYATTAPESLLTMRKYSEHPTELADLQGQRLVVASETEANAQRRVEQVKKLTGDSLLKARFMHRDYFQFRRTHKMVMVSNHRPRIDDTGNAIWRRIKLVPFDVTIPPSEQDLGLLEKLKAEAAGILAWCVEGCLAWQKHRMMTPAIVRDATDVYKADSDRFGQFVKDCCVQGDHWLSRDELVEAYREWSGEEVQQHWLYEAMRWHPNVKERQRRIGGKPIRGFVGIGLRTDAVGMAA